MVLRDRQAAILQNRYFAPNCMMRGEFSVEAMAPKVVELMFWSPTRMSDDSGR
jgi:hypothetical protein